ncbi:MAG: hypothetical protein QM768_21095 [Agriterribacter sp.]
MIFKLKYVIKPGIILSSQYTYFIPVVPPVQISTKPIRRIKTLLLTFKQVFLPVTVTGYLKKNPKNTSAFISNIIVFIKGDIKLLARMLTDNKGNFTITFTPKNEKSFDFYCTRPGIDTLLLSSVTTFESDTPEIIFYIPGNIPVNPATHHTAQYNGIYQ